MQSCWWLTLPRDTASDGDKPNPNPMPCRLPLPDMLHHRSLLVNSYPPVTAGQPRLDFSYYEYPDISRFVEVRLATRGCTPLQRIFPVAASCCRG